MALYSHINYPVTSTRKFDDGICEGLFTKFPTVKMCFFVLYRPPSACKESFNRLLKFVESCVAEETDDMYQLTVTGDLNFPFINWENMTLERGASTVRVPTIGQCIPEYYKQVTDDPICHKTN